MIRFSSKELTAFILILLASVLWNGCSKSKSEDSTYLRWVGDIEANDQDDPNFELCHSEAQVLQYFNLQQGAKYIGEKPEIIRYFKENYKIEKKITQSGWIRIRFIVNCNGEAGRFRLLESDKNYKAVKFDPTISSQLLNLTKKIKEWPKLSKKDKAVDYYFYLTFKIQNGEILEILP